MSKGKKIPEQDLIDEMQAAAMALGRQPRFSEMREFGDFSAQVYVHRYGSWKEAVEAAGIKYKEPLQSIGEEEIIRDVKRVKEKVGRRPSIVDYRRNGKYSEGAVRNNVGQWTEVLRIIEDDS